MMTYPSERIVCKPEERMTKLKLVAALGIAIFCTAPGSEAFAQTNAAPVKTSSAARTAEQEGKRVKMLAEFKLNAEEEKLVRGSKAAIIGTGMSAEHFDAHFRLVRVVNTQGSRQVVWKYSLGEYETIITDIVGFYTAGGERVDTHSITGTLGATYDIRETIPMQRAEKLMRECLGTYTGAAVIYQRLSADGQTGLYLTAHATIAPTRDAAREEREREERRREERQREERERRERARREAQKRNKGGATSGDPVEMKEEDEERVPFFIGYVNLETGKCIKAQGVIGHGGTP
jgi:hypothetical protein